jgi:hypothetical protein
MLQYPAFSNLRSVAIDSFSTLRFRALRDLLLAKLIGKSNRLVNFSHKAGFVILSKNYIGVKDIPVEKVIGTLSREGDFDGNFRPLKGHLRDRWIGVYLHQDEWEPIVVHKFDDQYYVEDGHHRLSVARAQGMAYIQAEVWDYSRKPVKIEPRQDTKAVTSGARVCVI